MYDDPEDNVQMAKTQDLASQQDPEEVEQMGTDFESFLQGIESGDVAELETEEIEEQASQHTSLNERDVTRDFLKKFY